MTYKTTGTLLTFYISSQHKVSYTTAFSSENLFNWLKNDPLMFYKQSGQRCFGHCN